jgi:hypothetical protein
MPLKTTYTPKTVNVTFLTDPNCTHVSLVPKGANWHPFEVVKQEETAMPAQIIQAVLLPNGLTLDEMLKDPECEFLAPLSGVKFAKSAIKKTANFTAYHVVGTDQFVEGSLTGKALPNGALVTFGELVPGATQEKTTFITIDVDDEPEATMETCSPPENEDIVEEIAAEVAEVNPAARIILAEIEVFQAVLSAALQQTIVSPQKRKDIIMTSAKSLLSFISSTLDTFDTVSTDANDSDFQFRLSEKNAEDISNDTGGINMFETKDELKQYILDTLKEFHAGEIVEAVEAEAAEVAETKTETVEAVVETPDTGEAIKALTDSVAAISAKLDDTVSVLSQDIKAVTAKQEALEHSTIGSHIHGQELVITNKKKAKATFDGAFV